MDFQTYSFELLANSDLRGLIFLCENNFCPYPSSIGESQISGEDVLEALHIGGISYAMYGESSSYWKGYGVLCSSRDLLFLSQLAS
jgi:hypothetical protein